jgi:hypothetical protein
MDPWTLNTVHTHALTLHCTTVKVVDDRCSKTGDINLEFHFNNLVSTCEY